MAPHCSPLAWKIPWTEEPGRLQSMGSLELNTTERLHFHFSLSCIGEGNGNPLQCSCLENPRDGGAWWAAVYGVAQSRTRLKWLSSSSSNCYYKDVYITFDLFLPFLIKHSLQFPFSCTTSYSLDRLLLFSCQGVSDSVQRHGLQHIASCIVVWTSVHSSLGAVFPRPNPLNLFVTFSV